MEGNGEEVSDFLLRIRELGDRRNKEDEERALQLEADIIAGREARRARRDERARSLSPQKDSPGVKSSLPSSRPETRDGEDVPGRFNDSTEAALKKLTGELADVTVSGGGSEPSRETNVDSSPQPTPTLSWQRRPKSMVGGPHALSRLSMTTDDSNDGDTPEKSRAQVAASLGLKEPAWFKQSQDRATPSATLKKADGEGVGGASKMALPGMSHPQGSGDFIPESTPEPRKGPLRTSFETLSTGRATRSGSLKSDRFVASMSPDLARSPSLTSTTSGRFELVDNSDGLARLPPMSPSQGRISPGGRGERTPSPTKGFGGFVQSAMLKREGSINKRWSRTDQVGGHSRNNSVSSARPPFPRAHTPNRDREQEPISRESSPAPDEPPSNAIKPEPQEIPRPTTRGRANTTGEYLGDRPSSFHLRRDTTPPASPTRTFEQKRWSPTKSSWLESALKKGTDNPQPQPQPTLTPAKPLERIPSKFNPDKPSVNPKPPLLKPKTIRSQELLTKASERPPEEPSKMYERRSSVVDLNRATLLSPTSVKPTGIDKPSIAAKPREQINFRAGLKPRPATDKGGEKEELPFLNVMSRLKSTKTQNYRAPNELKDRILEGKAGLSTTGGPQKNTRPDPLKESLLSAKVSLKHSETPPVRSTFSPVDLKPKAPPFEKKISAPARLEGEKKGSSIADRFNPNLANLLQRGPPIAASGNSFRPSKSPDESIVSVKSKGTPAEQSAGPLNHMTKGRARGPKRRAPTKAESAAQPVQPKALLISTPKPVIRKPSFEIPKMSPAPSELSLSRKTSMSSLGGSSQKLDKAKPPTPIKSPLLRGNSTSSLKENEKLPSEPAATQEETTKSPPLIRSLSSRVVIREPSRELLSPSPSSPSDPAKPIALTAPPIRLPKRGSLGVAGIPGLPGFSTPTELVEPSRALPRLFSRSVSPAPTPSLSLAPSPSPTPLPAPQSQHADNSAADKDSVLLLSEFFKGPSFHANKIDFDTMSILVSSPANTTEKVKTTQFEVSEMTGYGKLCAIPREEQHMFFDESMYLCTHHFNGTSDKTEVEVYLWSGAKVSESTIEDAQLFARKTARDNGGKLIQLKQARETPRFFHAIGGILITRRGTRQRSSPDDSFMLCGRSCFGGVAFDEVDMQVSSLCSGFSYIVSRKGGVYLWKGKGATPDEVGVARLVGFEISGGEVRECVEGDEPDAFFDALGGYSEINSADYWHLRPTSKKYASRLFKIDLQAQSKVVEIYPFCQDDLDPREIYVADAFYEFYIVIGSQSQSKREEFQAALQFTQEYALLAVSVEDRPFIPVSSVILGGAPREFKALFRTWDNAKIPTQWQPSQKPGIRLIGLSQAIEAMNA